MSRKVRLELEELESRVTPSAVMTVNNRQVVSPYDITKQICRARGVGRDAFVSLRRGEQILVIRLCETDVFQR